MELITRRQAMEDIAALSAATLALGAAPVPNRPTSAGGPRRLPNLLLTTHAGRRVRFYDDLIRDRIVLINFMYVSCEGICPRTTANLSAVQKALGRRVGRDVFMYSISLKPRDDTPAALRHYMEMHGIRPGWQFLTGSTPDIEVLRRTLGFVDPDPVLDRDSSSHIGLVLVGNDRLDRWAACPALAAADQVATLVGWMSPVKPGDLPATSA